MNLVTSTGLITGYNGVSVDKCRRLLRRHWIVEITHIYKKANKVADWLENWALKLPISEHNFTEPPAMLASTLQVNAWGVCCLHMVH